MSEAIIVASSFGLRRDQSRRGTEALAKTTRIGHNLHLAYCLLFFTYTGHMPKWTQELNQNRSGSWHLMIA
ncbi:hypothetical protein O181_104460 [Austropuccinia psidii MF-1]|uniref:Uncharacterized protein n=1 Tax=Austropuccinia psidii MF-1 TaxID=1389203 RepID=A0A9Q3JNJ4_9BASI|nr:hypothetical protein [Austropuccinia psidii MF-1]